MFALGILLTGCFFIEVFATWAISFGIISLGAIAIGDFPAVGALSVGKYFALGDNAWAIRRSSEVRFKKSVKFLHRILPM